MVVLVVVAVLVVVVVVGGDGRVGSSVAMVGVVVTAFVKKCQLL